jgi:hypothetical protein
MRLWYSFGYRTSQSEGDAMHRLIGRLTVAIACAALSLGVAGFTATPLHAAQTAQSSPGLVYKGGPVMHHPTIYADFWLPPGYSFEPPGAPATDKDYEDNNLAFFSDVSGSGLADVVRQYTDKKGPISGLLTYGGALIDSRPYPKNRGSQDNPLLDKDIVAEVKLLIKAKKLPIKSNETMFMVYTAYGVQSCWSDSGSQQDGCTFSQDNGYCGYHSFFQYKHANVVYSNLPDLNPDVCNTSDQPITAVNSASGDVAGDIQINNVSHELFESLTDPLPDYKTGWVSPGGQDVEIGDLCDLAWGPRDDNGGDVALNGYDYFVQAEWSNQDGGCVLARGGPLIPQGSS